MWNLSARLYLLINMNFHDKLFFNREMWYSWVPLDAECKQDESGIRSSQEIAMKRTTNVSTHTIVSMHFLSVKYSKCTLSYIDFIHVILDCMTFFYKHKTDRDIDMISTLWLTTSTYSYRQTNQIFTHSFFVAKY